MPHLTATVFDGFGKADVLDFLDEGEDISGLVAAEAVVELAAALTEKDGVFSEWKGQSPV